MKSLQKLSAKLSVLNHQLATLQANGIKKALKSVAINIIFAIEKLEALIEQITKATQSRKLELKTPRCGWRAWVAKISGKRDTVHGGFTKEFFKPTSREFGKKGEISATFQIQIDLNQTYQDSDGDFWVFENLEGDIKVICWEEVKYRFSQV